MAGPLPLAFLLETKTPKEGSGPPDSAELECFADDMFVPDSLAENVTVAREVAARLSDAKYWKNNEGVLGAKFDFVWTMLSKDLVTGNAIWTVDDVSDCVSLHKLQKLDPLKKDVIKIQIVNNLLLPCLYACQTHIHSTPQEGLLALPAEVTSQILKNLPAASLCSLAVVHPLLKFLTSEPKLWQSRFKKDFPLAKPIVNARTNWKELYKTEYLAGRAIYRRSAVLPTSRRHFMNDFDPSAAFLSDLDFFREHTRYGSRRIRLF